MKTRNCISIKSIVFTLFVLNTLLYSLHNTSTAQVTNSPYSRYGIGDIGGKGFGQNFAMGGTSIALQNDSTPYFINSGNPASYSGLDWTSAELGANVGVTQLQSSNVKQSLSSASLAYLSLGMPFKKKWWGASIGLIPYSSVGYKVSDKQDITNIGNVNFIYEGSGGVNQFYFGNGIKPFYKLKNKALKTLSLGVNASYLFGNIDNIRRSVFPSSGAYFNTRSGTTTRIGDIYFDYGLQYACSIDSIKGRVLKEKVKLLFGATFANQSLLSAKIDSLSYTYFNSSNFEVVKDTLQNVQDVKGQIQLPLSFGVGFGIRKGERLLIAADYRIQNWSSYKIFERSQNLKNSMSASLGVQFTPKPPSGGKNNYARIVSYRAGIRYAETPLELKNTRLKEYGVTLGLSLPVEKDILFRSFFSRVNIGVEFGQRGTSQNGLIKEQYIKGTIGFTVNDPTWFLRRKVD